MNNTVRTSLKQRQYEFTPPLLFDWNKDSLWTAPLLTSGWTQGTVFTLDFGCPCSEKGWAPLTFQSTSKTKTSITKRERERRRERERKSVYSDAGDIWRHPSRSHVTGQEIWSSRNQLVSWVAGQDGHIAWLCSIPLEWAAGDNWVATVDWNRHTHTCSFLGCRHPHAYFRFCADQCLTLAFDSLAGGCLRFPSVCKSDRVAECRVKKKKKKTENMHSTDSNYNNRKTTTASTTTSKCQLLADHVLRSRRRRKEGRKRVEKDNEGGFEW